ncbi:Threonylcarbamoyl-AMP synthase [uncultured archaeon]|nr:Threonylcarbamoyl-AMP synthase [uncultured archaeon]
MVKIIKLQKGKIKEVLQEAKKVVLAKGVILYPTDTVYGIGGDATEPEVARRVKEIKGSSDSKQFSVIMSDIKMIEDYCEVGLWEEMILKKYLPGPYTFILKIHRPLAVTSDLTLGVRIPELDICNRLSEAIGKPIISTSANKSGKEPPKSFAEVDPGILNAVDLAIDGGQTRYRGTSDVVDLINRKLVRKGVGSIDLTQPL